MRILLLASVAALGFAAYTPAQAMPIAAGASSSVESNVTDVRWRKHHRHYRHYGRRMMRRGDLSTGMRGYGPTDNMSKTNGGRAGR